MNTAPDALAAPESLRRVIQRALQPVPADRYQAAGDMALDLRSFLAEEGNSYSAQELGRWVREIEGSPPHLAASSVDQAVRQLLGEEGMDGVGSPAGTAIFASSTAKLPAEATAETVPPTPRETRNFKRFKLTLVAVAILGVCGWLLWGLNIMGTQDPPAPDRRGVPRDGMMTSLVRPAADVRAAPARTVTSIITAPPGATVFINGKSRGVTPLKVSLPAGSFWMKLLKKGYHPVEKMISESSARAEIEQELTPVVTPRGVGRLTINSLPWSRVRLDGRVIGNTPLIKTPVRAGRHRVELLSPRGEVRKRFTAHVPRAGHRSYTFDLTK